MKNILVLFLGLMMSFALQAQIFQKDKYPTKYVKGTKYYVHIVEKGHTIYAISKKYAVDLPFILKANPGIENGLHIGQEVLIPVYRVNRNIARRYTPELKGKYLIHTVQKKETLFSISKKYGVDITVIKAYNPILDEGLKVGNEIRIPAEASNLADENMIDPAGGQNDPRFIYHEVYKQETLYSLSKLYGVTVDQIRGVNDGLPEGLKVGAVIKIPRLQQQTGENDVETGKGDDFFTANPTLAYKDQYEVALLLPFRGEEALEQTPLDNNSFSLEFLQGFQIAAAEREGKPGSKIKIHVLDTESDPIATKKLLTGFQLQQVDLFVGPLYKTPLIEVLDYARNIGSKVVCPVQQSPKLLQNNPHYTNIWPSDFVQMRKLANYMAREYIVENVVVIKSDSTEDQVLSKVFIEEMNGLLQSNVRRFSDQVKEIFCAGIKMEDLEAMLDETGVNNIVFPSNDVLAVTDLMNKISELKDKYRIRIFGTEKWLNFKQLDEELLEHFEVHLAMGMFVDFDNPLSKAFAKKYREEYKTDPGKFAFLGYNTGVYFLSALNQYGLIFPSTYDQVMEVTPNMEMQLKRILPETGFQNHGVQIIRFNNWQWEKVAK